MDTNAFINEVRAYEMLESVGLSTPKWGLAKHGSDVAKLPFAPGEKVVVKGVADDVWHKSDLGLVRFPTFDVAELTAMADEMESIGKQHGTWIGTLVVERVPFKLLSGLPTEALVALRKTPEAGWTLVMGLGGLHTNAWGEEIKPLLWPIAYVTPEQALADLKAHWLGKIWLGNMRQGSALTTEAILHGFLTGLWKLVSVLEAQQVTLFEMNPVVLGPTGQPLPLDGVGTINTNQPKPPLGPAIPVEELRRILVTPRSIAIAGVSSKPGTPGRIMLENLLRSKLPKEALKPIKPGEKEILGLPCLQGMEDLKANPVDILILSLPAPLTVQAIEQLCDQGGGASVLYLVPGGLGDGADTQGLGKRVVALIQERRAKGLWTPALVGPNGLGFMSSEDYLNTLFIPEDKLSFMPKGGGLALVSQSGAFLVTRFSLYPELPIRYTASIGNQIDVRLSHFVRALGNHPDIQVVATYIEGFAAGDLEAYASAARELQQQGKRVIAYKGGRSAEGMKAASSHTGALAGDWALQKALLEAAGVVVCEDLSVFDAAINWVAAYPKGRPAEVAVTTNAGYESVVSADLLEGKLKGHVLSDAKVEEVKKVLEAHGLAELVNPRLPLDVTPMADNRAYLDCAKVCAESGADTVIMAIVPLTKRIETVDEGAMAAFSAEMADVATKTGKRLAIVVEAGPLFEPFRRFLMKAGLPVFTSVEKALHGLRVLA